MIEIIRYSNLINVKYYTTRLFIKRSIRGFRSKTIAFILILVYMFIFF